MKRDLRDMGLPSGFFFPLNETISQPRRTTMSGEHDIRRKLSSEIWQGDPLEIAANLRTRMYSCDVAHRTIDERGAQPDREQHRR